MHNDEFESSNSTHKSDKSSGEHSRLNKSRKSHHYDEDDHPHKRSREKQRTTAIALSVITCVFMCVIGYEIIRENNPKSDLIKEEAEEKRPSLILSKLSLMDNNRFLAQLDDEEDGYENHQIRMLQDQNRKQANKIKALRQELLDKMQAVHDIKANLFKQEGDPRDKAKIADLSRQLEEKEKTANQLSTNLKSLEFELLNLNRKIEHSEITRDALATMIESHRAAREQEHILAEKQMEKLNQANAEEISSLNTTVNQLQQSNAVFEQENKEKITALNKMNRELEQQYLLYEEKTKEHQNLAELYQNVQKDMGQQILDLVALLEWEAASKSRIREELQTALEKQELEKSTIISLLEAELQKRNEVIALHEAEQNLHRNKMGFTAHEAQEQLLDLIATLEFEMTRTSYLQKEMDKTIYLQKLSLGDHNQAIHAMEGELRKQHSIIEQKSEELENLSTILKITRNDNHERISDLVALYEIEAIKAKKLQEDYDQSISEKDQLLVENETQKRKLLAKNKKQAQEKKQLINEIEDHRTERSALLDTHVRNSEDIEYLKTTHQLSEQLMTEKAQEAQAQIQGLENTISSLKDQIEAKDVLLAARQLELHSLLRMEAEAVNSYNQQASELSHHIEAANLQISNLHAEISELLPHKQLAELHLEKIASLETDIQNLNRSLDHKESSIAEKQVELLSVIHLAGESDQQLREYIQELVQHLENDKQHLNRLNREYQEALTYKDAHAAGEQRLRELEKEIDDLQQQVFANQTQLQTGEQQLTRLIQEQQTQESDLKHQIAELDDLLNHEISKVAMLEEMLKEALNNVSLEEHHEVTQKLYLAMQKSSELENHLQRQHEFLSQKENEIHSLLEAKLLMEDSYVEQINNLQAQITHEQFKTDTLKSKFKDHQLNHSEQAKKIETFESELSLLNQQLLAKEKELLITEEKLLLTLPQLDLLSDENEHLQNSHAMFEEKYRETTQLLHQQHQQLKELTQKLEEEQAAFSKTIALYEHQKNTAQQATQKIELAHLKASLLEDQLAVNEALLKNKEKELLALEQSKVVLKSDMENSLEALQHDSNIKTEKLRELRLALDNERREYENKIDNKDAELQELKVAVYGQKNLENTLNEKDMEIKELKLALDHLQKGLENKIKDKETQLKDLKLSLENERQALEVERKKNSIMHEDFKKVISAYSSGKEKLKDLEEISKIVERNKNSRDQ